MKENKKIVGIKFEDKLNPKIFSGREYSYYTTEDLEVGDIVFAPTKFGINVGIVSNVDIKEDSIKNIQQYMKTIDSKIDKEGYLNGIKD